MELTVTENDKINLVIMDVTGRIIKTINEVTVQPGSNNIKVSLTGCHAGAYFCKIKYINAPQTLRLLKN